MVKIERFIKVHVLNVTMTSQENRITINDVISIRGGLEDLLRVRTDLDNGRKLHLLGFFQGEITDSTLTPREVARYDEGIRTFIEKESCSRVLVERGRERGRRVIEAFIVHYQFDTERDIFSGDVYVTVEDKINE